MIDSAVFAQLKQKYGSHSKVAQMLGISSRAYFNWRIGNVNKAEIRVQHLIDVALAKDPCEDTSSAVPAARP